MQRLPGLDLLRALAIVAVICTHSWLVGGMGNGFGWIESYGWMGVDLFFVLSGYLIGHQLFVRYERSGRLDLKAFYRQRAYRILPAYLVVVAIYFAAPGLREQPVIQPLWQFLTFTMNLFVDQRVPHAFSSAWSLCVEEYFYLLFPLAILVLAPRIRARRVVVVMASLMLLGMAWRGFAWSQSAAPADGGVWEMDIWRYMQLVYYPTYARLDGLMCGVALAMLSVYQTPLWQRLQRNANALALLGIIVVGFAAWIPRHPHLRRLRLWFPHFVHRPRPACRLRRQPHRPARQNASAGRRLDRRRVLQHISDAQGLAENRSPLPARLPQPPRHRDISLLRTGRRLHRRPAPLSRRTPFPSSSRST